MSFCTLKTFCGCIGWCSEADEIYKICSVIGSPAELEWAEGIELANAINYQFPQVSWSYIPVVICTKWQYLYDIFIFIFILVSTMSIGKNDNKKFMLCYIRGNVNVVVIVDIIICIVIIYDYFVQVGIFVGVNANFVAHVLFCC